MHSAVANFQAFAQTLDRTEKISGFNSGPMTQGMKIGHDLDNVDQNNHE